MKSYFIALALIVIYFNVNAQTTPSIPNEGVTITKAIAASPDAAALGKYGSIPVSPYTGVPNISIPFYTINSGSISLPISISYHAGGNKVEEMASSVGLGWALNAGGVITRTIRGKADEDLLGFLDPGHYVQNILSTISTNAPYTTVQLNSYINEISDDSMDGETDMYNFNFGNYSGRFEMDSYGNVTTIPLTRIKFTFTVGEAPDGPPMITGFTAVTPDGLTYVFGDDNDGNNAYETTANYSSCGSAPAKPKYYATSWFLKKITDPTGHQVTFNYTSENYNISLNQSDTRYQYYSSTPGASIASMPEEVCTSTNSIRGSKLSSITFENGNINFHVSPRNDVSNTNLIDSLSITGGDLFKTYRLYYTNISTARLRLDSLVDYIPSQISETNVKVEHYRFQYNLDNGWKSYIGYNQDYWGYNNGAGNTTLLPSMLYYPRAGTTVLLPGADRTASEGAMLGGMLTQITYPTGGYTTFNYEANQESNLDLGGSSSKYPPIPNEFAKCNDPASPLYHYDILHGNPGDMITIVSKSGNSVPVGITASGLETTDANTNDVTAYLAAVDSLGNTLPSGGQQIKNSDTIVYLTPGYYHLMITDGKNKAYPTGTVKYSVDINWHTTNPLLFQNYLVGGLRIQQIADYDGINPKPINVKTYQYTAPGKTTSSGWLDFQPVYNYYLGVNSGGGLGPTYTTTFFVQNSVSNYPLATTQGSVVGYSHVIELNGIDGKNGKTEYFYTNSQTDPDNTAFVQLNSAGIEDNGFPFPPPMTHDWRRGLLLKQTTYRSTGDTTYAKVQDKTYSYGSLYGSFADNLRVGFSTKPAIFGQSNEYMNGAFADGVISVAKYTDYTDFTYLTGETTTDYSSTDLTKYVQTTTNYQMDSTTLQLANITSINSKNEKIIQSVTYPSHYNTSGVTGSASMAGISGLKSLGIISYPIEEVTQKANADGSNLRTVKAVLTTYKPSMPVRDSIYELQSIQPVTGFVNSSSGAISINKDSHYQPVVDFQKYDRNGNILQENKIGAPLHSYIWGYPDQYSPYYVNSYPIAEVVNADTSSIAYTNFESFSVAGTGYGNWTYSNQGIHDATAPMGSGCYQLTSGNISKGNLTSTTSYVISAWAKSGTTITITGGTVAAKPAGAMLNGWTYREYQITGATTVTIGGTGLIDELRLYPTNAQMSTYTYVPLVGMSSSCSVKSEFTYYMYDNLGRLTDVKDQYGNTLKHTDYHYQGQGQ